MPHPDARELPHDSGNAPDHIPLTQEVPKRIAATSNTISHRCLLALPTEEVDEVLSYPDKVVALWEHVAAVALALEDYLVMQLRCISPVDCLPIGSKSVA